MSKDFFDDFFPNELVNYGELMIYDNQFVEPMEADLEKTKLTVADNEGRIAALEAQIPGGGTGTGAYLNLGGTPDRYPLASECVGVGSDEMGFVVVAKPDGMYFYNPVTKQFIPPKKGGGNMAVHGQFPEVFDASHELHHAGRVTRSGIFFSEYDKVGVTAWTDPDKACQVMVTVHELGYEQHVVLGKEGLAYKLFKPGDNNADWVHYQGTPGGGGGTGPVVIDIPFTHLNDVPDTYAGMGGKIVAIKATEDGLEFIDAPTGGGGPVGPVIETFEDLLDTPNDYTGHAGRAVVVNPGENGLTFADRDPDVGGRILAELKGGEHVVNSRGVTGSFLHAASSPDAVATAPHNVINLATGATQAYLPKVCPHDQDVMADHEVRAGAIIYVHNQSTSNKRVRITTGDAFMIGGVENVNPQTISAGCTAILYPTYSGGKGVWYILSQNTIMPADLASLSMDFTELGDTPTAYTGEAGKIVAVKTDMTGLEFVDAPIAGITAAEATDIALTAMGEGKQLLNANGIGGGFAQTTQNVSTSHIASGPVVLHTGNIDGRTVTMPAIVPRGTTTITNTQVREGRITYLINHSSKDRVVSCTGTDRFYINGGANAGPLTIPSKVVWMLMPGIWGNGDRCWMFMGNFGSVHTNKTANLIEAGFANGNTAINTKAVSFPGYEISTQINADKVNTHGIVFATGTTTARNAIMPEIVDKSTATLTTSQVREGHRFWVHNRSDAVRNIRPFAGQKIWNNGTATTVDRVVPAKIAEEYWALKIGGEFVWMVNETKSIDPAKNLYITQDEKDFVAGLESGDTYLPANATASPASVIASSTFTAEQAALTHNFVTRVTTGGVEGTMPQIVSVTTNPIPAGAVRLGFEWTLSNHNAGGGATILRYQNGSQLWNNGVFEANQNIAANTWVKLVAMHISGSTYGWVKMASGTH